MGVSRKKENARDHDATQRRANHVAACLTVLHSDILVLFLIVSRERWKDGKDSPSSPRETSFDLHKDGLRQLLDLHCRNSFIVFGQGLTQGSSGSFHPDELSL